MGSLTLSAPSETGEIPAAEHGANGSEPLVISSLPPPPPPLAELPAQLHRMNIHPAPMFFRDDRGGLRRQAKRALNLVLRFIGRSQQAFNRETTQALTLLMAEIRSLRRWTESLAGTPTDRPLDPIVQELATLRKRVGYLQDCVSTEILDSARHRLDRLSQLDTALADVGRRLETLHAQDMSLLREIREGFTSHAEWITVLQRKYQGVSLDARELTEGTTSLPEPRLVDPDAYARKLAAMGSAVRVNLGCGEKPMDGYLNVDLRPLPGVDVLADVHRLPFEPGSLQEVASAHLIEHFREHNARTRLLPYWKTLLKPDGRLRIVCPNWAVMLERLRAGQMTLQEFKLVTFGWQDYEGDDHFAMYTPETLRELLVAAGFGRIEVVVTDRMDGMCPEMELVAHP